MTINQRLKLVIKWLIENGIAKSQKEIGFMLGYKTESSFSQILNGKVPIPKGLIEKASSLHSDINSVWIELGEGDMLKKANIKNQEENNLNNSDIISHSSNEEWLRAKIDTLIEDNTRNSMSVERMSKTAETNTQMIAKLFDMLYKSGVIISDQTQKGGAHAPKDEHNKTSHNDEAKAG